MAILKVGNARNSSSSSPMEQHRSAKLEEPEPESELTDRVHEVCQVGDTVFSIPFELLELPDLKNVLSLEAWNFHLTEEEREQLLAYMPGNLDQETFSRTIKEIFSGGNIFFGNPVTQLFQLLKSGCLQPKAAQCREGLKTVQQNEHYHVLRKYHNSMVNQFIEMQTLWKQYPDLDIQGRLEMWRKWKETNMKPDPPMASRKSFEAVRTSKVAETPKVKGGDKTGTTEHPNAQVTTKPRGLLKLKAGKFTAKSGGVQIRKSMTAEDSPPLEPDQEVAVGNESTQGGTSSSSEKKRKSFDGADSSKRKKRRRGTREGSLSISDDEDTVSAEEVTCRSNKAGPNEFQCVANFEANNDDMEVQHKRRSRRKEKDSSESPVQNKQNRKAGSDVPFSVILFLSALRRALLLPFEETASGDPAEATVCSRNLSGPSSPSDENVSNDDPSRGDFSSVPSAEILRRMYANPGDAQVLELQEPLQDLVWGALKLLSSKVAPAGAKGWKPLAAYEKERKAWYWIGPPGSVDEAGNLAMDEWGVLPKVLLKLGEAFAAWYKNGEATRQQMAQLKLPPPPVVLSQMDDKERFRDMRAQKSLITIPPSSDDMRAYFRKEELLRYSFPERAFAYTRSDGLKSIVAPLRRGGGKPNSKARDHFMLKPDRPPHVTILCLVRDAAARLPGGRGTRADVCALIRDSQYVVEEVSEAQMNQVVSGALDRLHYERDPCVRFDSEKKLWLYLHTDRHEEDFEDDGTSSTKRSRKQYQQQLQQQQLQQQQLQEKRDAEAQQQTTTGSFDSGSPAEPESSFGIEHGSIYSAGKAELVYNKSGSLPSPRVLNNNDGGRQGEMLLMELPRSGDVRSEQGSLWNEQGVLISQRHEAMDEEADVDGEGDGDAMLHG